MIEPGKALIGVDLDKTPSPGVYNITVKIEAWDIDNYEQGVNGGAGDPDM